MLADSPRAEGTPRTEATTELSRVVAASSRADAGADGVAAVVSAVGGPTSPPATTSGKGGVAATGKVAGDAVAAAPQPPPAASAPAPPRPPLALGCACNA